MSLFPAYARESSENKTEHEAELCSESLASLEAQLLASDNDEELEVVVHGAEVASCNFRHSPPEHQDYYLDCKYDSLAPRELGGSVRGGSAGVRSRRYYSEPAPTHDAYANAELAQRTRAFRGMLAENPADEALWLRFIEFQERSRDAEAVLSAASEAAARLVGSRRVRAALHRARDLALPPHRRLDLLREDLAAAGAGAGGGPGGGGMSSAELTELWLRVLETVCEAGGGAELDAATRAALAATRTFALAYPHILYVYGGYLRAAGLWERLVLMLELVASMNFPPAAFPPRILSKRRAEQERDLQDLEDKTISSGLPLSTVWVRVETARAAAHWRAPPDPSDPSDPSEPSEPSEPSDATQLTDPQRAPLPADVADLLLPAADPDAAALLLVHALQLAKVPLLPCSGYALAATDAGNWSAGDAREMHGGEALLALLRAARRLPPAHPARPSTSAHAARLVALFVDPPHYFTDDAGYLSWVTSLWDACCGWVAGERREALLCWRLRWLHALLLLLDTQEETGRREERRMRGEARGALKRFGGASALAFAQHARLERAAGDCAAARRAALHALRAALSDPRAAPHQRLYVARVTSEVCDEEAIGEWATACAALDRALPSDDQLTARPPRDLLHRALLQCEERCDQLEQQLQAEPSDHVPSVLHAMLPAPAEWSAARARLASPARRAELVRRVRTATFSAGAAAARYWEQSACALVVAAVREHRLAQYARALAPLFPHNAMLALACSGAPLWAWEQDGTQEERLRAMTGGAREHRAALAHALPALLRAAAAHWEPREAARAANACARAGRAGAGGALLHTARLESEARAARGRPEVALYAALDRHPQHKWLAVRGAAWCAAQAPALADVLLERHPQHKWLAVRGAAWCAAQAPALADVLLERQLRAHALLDELAPPPHAS